MGYELLERVTELLEEAGLRTGEEYPGLERPEIDSPIAAVGLRELDMTEGAARFNIRVLSPRILGGWCCQVWVARAVEALSGDGLTCRTEEMEYSSGSDCFCVTVTASMPVIPGGEVWTPGERWQVLCGEAVQEGVSSFQAVRNQGRRIVGSHWESEPMAITSGNGGWELELVQWVRAEPEEQGEPFVLTVREEGREHCYTGCCWNETVYAYTQRGLCLTRRGFALGREVREHG